ncbi:hypothetical protein PBI_MIMI_151 [Arthrobacter phage Mimi]|nr:hypothetical protein PBI_MIMI_231 [Arthrobacter phage Mimi]
MISENARGVARLLLFEQKAQEIYTEMLERGLCEEGDEIVIFGGPKSTLTGNVSRHPKTRDGSEFKNGVHLWSTDDAGKLHLTLTSLREKTK